MLHYNQIRFVGFGEQTVSLVSWQCKQTKEKATINQ
jgi:hypothetical protein